MNYQGWVPNATGNISFSVIGDPLGRSHLRIKQHLPTSTKRWIVLSQLRHDPDRLVSEWIASLLRYLFGPRYPDKKKVRRYSVLRYTLTATSVPTDGDLEGALDGVITVSIPGIPDDDRLFARASQIADTLLIEENQIRHGLDVTPPLQGVWDGAVGNIRANSAFDCSFRMLRNGKCFFCVDSNRHKQLDKFTTLWLVNQCYYFLRDAVHQHYHHGQTTDAIIGLTEDGTDPDWRLQTLRNLYRKVISLRRSKSERVLSDALGVIAYANVFMNIFKSEDYKIDGKPTKSPLPPLPTYHPAELGQSIMIRRDSSKTEYERWRTELQFILASILAVGVIYATICDKFTKGSSADDTATAIYFFLSNWPVSIVIMPIALYVLYVLLLGIRDPASNKIVRNLYRLFAWVPKNVILTIVVALFIALVCFSIYSFW